MRSGNLRYSNIQHWLIRRVHHLELLILLQPRYFTVTSRLVRSLSISYEALCNGGAYLQFNAILKLRPYSKRA